MAVVSYQGSDVALGRLLADLPRILAGLRPDVAGIGRAMRLRLGVGLMSKIQQDFIRKSRGQTGEDGIKWKPLERTTIAQRRTTAAERRAAGVGGRRVRGLLTPSQDRQWRMIYATRRASMISRGVPASTASARAAAIAWTILKNAGAQTKIGLFGGRTVDILRDTGELFRSFTPGVEDRPARTPGQIFRERPGQVIVGTNKKTWHHKGTRKLPSRPFWPLNGQLPPAWWRYLLGVYTRGLAVVLARFIANGGRVNP